MKPVNMKVHPMPLLGPLNKRTTPSFAPMPLQRIAQCPLKGDANSAIDQAKVASVDLFNADARHNLQPKRMAQQQEQQNQDGE